MAALGSPFVIIFISSNIVNVGNLAFNLLFSRWMGPVVFGDMAVTLTLMLAVMGILTSIQMAVSQKVAEAPDDTRSALLGSLAKMNRLAIAASAVVFPLVLALIYLGRPGEALGMAEPQALAILALAIPFVAPLSLVRGVINGQIDVLRIVLSAQGEMFVRLILAIAAWQLGLGLSGVVWALVLSIIAGWVAMGRVLPSLSTLLPKLEPQERAFAGKLFVIALPFALLQASQVILLDGDVFLAKLLLSETEAGLVAALSLVQRIQFFACFALASILLPSVARAVAEGGSGLREAAPVAALFLAVAVPFILGAAFLPELMLNILFGSGYLDAKPALLPTAFAACAFTFAYLVATFMAGRNARLGIWMICAMALAQPVIILIGAQIFNAFDLASLLWIKLACLTVLSLGVAGVAITTLHKARLASGNGAF